MNLAGYYQTSCFSSFASYFTFPFSSVFQTPIPDEQHLIALDPVVRPAGRALYEIMPDDLRFQVRTY